MAENAEKPRVYVVPVDERYSIIQGSDTTRYIYDYLKYTTVTNEEGKTKVFMSNFEASREYEKLVEAYKLEYPRLVAEAEKRAFGVSHENTPSPQ